MLCPSWPASGTWNQSTHINWQQYLDAAYGGPVAWETAIDRQARKKKKEEQVSAPTLLPDRTTNVTIALLQQVDILVEWWAAAEAKCSIGLPGRFVFSFGSAQPPGPPCWSGFGAQVVLPIVEDMFALVLKHYGPHAAIPVGS